VKNAKVKPQPKKAAPAKKAVAVVKSAPAVIKPASGLFAGIIGQEVAKAALSNFVGSNLKSDSPVPVLSFFGERGSGKTHLMRATIKALKADVVLPSCDADLATLPTPNSVRGVDKDRADWHGFCEHLLVSLSSDKRVVICFDELHELGKGPKFSPNTFAQLFSFLMKVCILSKEGRPGMVQIGETAILWNPAKHFIVTGTNFPEKLDDALRSRLRVVNMAPYKPDELAGILAGKTEKAGVEVKGEAVAPLINCCRSSAREVDTILGELVAVLGARGKKVADAKDVQAAMSQSGLFPFGFSAEFVRLLEKLGGETLRETACKALFPSIAGDLRGELAIAADRKLTHLQPNGWNLTEKGKRALQTWLADGFKW
jgi:Holliday junction resolvasome RuvABC ATP-dependent DNA helicase subunit